MVYHLLTENVAINIATETASSFLRSIVEIIDATRIYHVTFFDIYGLHTAIVLSIAAVIVGVAYLHREQQRPLKRRQRFEYPL